MPIPTPKRDCRTPTRWFVTRTGILALLAAFVCMPATGIEAKGPPLATTTLEASAYDTPSYDATIVAVLPAGAEVELTGNAAPGFLGVIYDDREVFVPAQYLSLGSRPGIDTAVTVAEAPLLDAPLRDANVRLTIPEGQTIILTGASLDGYDAATYDGAGGWVDSRGLAR